MNKDVWLGYATLWRRPKDEMYDAGVTHGPRNIARRITKGNWKPYFAWRPVEVNGKRVWFKKVFRRKIEVCYDINEEFYHYEYGNIFDVIKDSD
jgi:hypothetical protein